MHGIRDGLHRHARRRVDRLHLLQREARVVHQTPRVFDLSTWESHVTKTIDLARRIIFKRRVGAAQFFKVRTVVASLIVHRLIMSQHEHLLSQGSLASCLPTRAFASTHPKQGASIQHFAASNVAKRRCGRRLSFLSMSSARLAGKLPVEEKLPDPATCGDRIVCTPLR